MDLAHDPELRAELEAARAWGVPWRRWAGWEPVEVTTYEYDDAGRLVRAVTRREPEWGKADRAAALALAEWEAQLCSGCHHPLAETTDPGHEYAYRPAEVIRCHRCTAQAKAAKDYEDAQYPEALLIPVDLDLSRVSRSAT